MSGFTSEEDKKHQKSITSFLCANRPANKICAEVADKTEKQTPCPQRESFFNQKRAARQQELLQYSKEIAGTSKDQSVTFALGEEPKADADDAKEKPDFTCPICLMKQGDWDLQAFNKHIDKCLSTSPSSGSSDMPSKGEHVHRKFIENNGNDIHANNLKNKMVEVTPCDDLYDFVIDKNTLCAIQGNQTSQKNLKECNSDIICEDTSKNIVKEKKNEKHIKSTPPSSSMCMEEPTLICPVCNTQQDTTDLAAFNRHVDICLNKGILEELKDDKGNTNRSHALGHQNGKYLNIYVCQGKMKKICSTYGSIHLHFLMFYC